MIVRDKCGRFAFADSQTYSSLLLLSPVSDLAFDWANDFSGATTPASKVAPAKTLAERIASRRVTLGSRCSFILIWGDSIQVSLRLRLLRSAKFQSDQLAGERRRRDARIKAASEIHPLRQECLC